MEKVAIQEENLAKTLLTYGKNVTIIGNAHKPGVSYTTGSSSLVVGHYIEQHGGNVNYYDEHTGDLDLAEDWTDVYLIGHWDDYVAELKFSDENIATVVDPSSQWTTDRCSGHVVHYGDTRK